MPMMTTSFRAEERELTLLDAIAKRLGRNKSDTIRLMINQFGRVLELETGKVAIEVEIKAVQVEEL